MRKTLVIALAMLGALATAAQDRSFWTQTSESAVGRNLFRDQKRPANFLLFQLNESAMRQSLRSAPSERSVPTDASSFILSVPDANGKQVGFHVVEAPCMEPGLMAKFPGISSYTGLATDGSGATLRFAFSQRGFNGTIFYPDRSTVYISRVDASSRTYMVLDRLNVPFDNNFQCLTQDMERLSTTGEALRNADDSKLRTMRIAMAASGEFSAMYVTGTETSDAERRSNVQAKLNELLTRCNGIFEKDFALRLLMISNNDAVIYLDASTDPWNGGDINAESQAGMSAALADGDYDIGHSLLGTGGGGNAGCIGCVCVNGSKGRGYTNLSNWNSDALIVDYLPHEIGHQLGGNHTFSHAEESGSPAQKEPGSGTTIMGYAGITGPNDVAAHSHDNFHAISIQQITDNLKAKSCPVVSAAGDATPTANGGPDFTIPKSTPFVLKGSGTDANAGDVLSYTWEQMDGATSFPWFPSTTATTGPAFRCFPANLTGIRYFPSLANILDGSNTNQWEKLPAVSRTMNFRLTVRDNHPSVGQNNSDDVVVTVDGASGPFAVTSPNTNVNWCPGTHTVTWSVNGTDGGAVNATHVNILLSTDGGNTFPTVLAANTPNDGTEDVTIGCVRSTQARIKVEAVGNIFFDISDANFSVGDNTLPTFTAPPNIVIFKDANCNYDASLAVTGDVTDEADNCSTGLNATFSDITAPGSCVGETVISRVWELTDGCGNRAQRIQTITIRDNTPPTFTAPPNKIIFADASCNYNASPAITGDVTDEADNCDNTLDATYSDVVVNGSCIGEKIITRTWRLSDDCGNTTTHNQVITVKDNTPPVISNASTNPSSLWPPNHKMVLVTVNYTATDNCSPVTTSLTVSSNEALNGLGDGNTAPDWQVLDNHHVNLRAERSGPGNGRIYAIRIKATDDCGNTSYSFVYVTVSHDQSITRATTLPVHELALSVSPNPARAHFVLKVQGPGEGKMMLQVVNALGTVIETRNVTDGQSLTLGDRYRPGTYFVRLINGSRTVTAKLTKLSE